jgi:PAS domain S-box-containing protein
MSTDHQNPDGLDSSGQVILVIDDDPNSLDILAEYLQACHFTILIAEDGESGLKRADYAKPDLILLDILMPGIDGYETCRRLKAMESTRDIPVIFMTALTEAKHQVIGFEAGAVDYVTKPFKREEVVARVGVHLRIHELTTGLHKANESLRGERDIFVGGPTVVFKWKNQEGWPVEYVSPNVADQFGYTPEELISGKVPYSSIVHPDDLARVAAEVSAYSKQGATSFEQTYRIARSDGCYCWIYDFTKVVRGPDKAVTQYNGYVLDITERKLAEERIRKLNQELEQRVAERTAQLETAIYDLENFNYSASHDLRIPLRAIDGFSRILLEEYAQRLDVEGIRLLNVVRDNTKRMAQFIDDMQAFSQTGRLEMKLSEIDMEKIALEAFEELQSQVAASKLQLTIRHLPPAFGDSTMLRQVFTNLLSNAIKFSRTREVPIIRVDATVEGSEIVYSVMDNGVGFDMRYADKLFGVFHRLHGVGEFEGSGIGLAIVKRIITRHGGRVWVESKVDSGSTFYFSLPQSSKNMTT